MKRGSILILDDDESIRCYLSDFLLTCGYETESFSSGADAIRRLGAGAPPDLMLLDIMMPGLDGLEVLAQAKRIDPALSVIILSGVGQIKTIVQAMRTGASDYLTKPFDNEELELAIENVLEKRSLRDEVRTLRRRLDLCTPQFDLLSSNEKMARIKEIARHVADFEVPVLILGESGAGKEVLARYIHSQSKRADRPFVKVNCAALPNDLLESELFGYDKGAFTGAANDKPGKFEQANGGCILLDEIGEMSPQLQAKLLHVLQDGEYSRLGARRSIRVDTRILASTNKVLKDSVAKREFREDLYYRLDVIRIEIPPLRERPEDIPLLCNYFLQKYGALYNSTSTTMPPDLCDRLMQYHWPGNVRQVENLVKRFLILSDVQSVLADLTRTEPAAPPLHAQNLKELGAAAAEKAERDAVLRALEGTNWNRKLASEELGICYKALLNKLKKWNLDNRARTSHVPGAPVEAEATALS
jgi:two-component system response regulator AtoC